MNRCVNMNHPDFKALLNESGIDFLTLYADVSLWQDRNDTDVIPSIEQLVPPVEKVEYRFVAVDKILAKLLILNKWWSDKSISKETFWKKFKELGIPNGQVELYKESNADTFEQVVLDTLAKYSFEVEIKTSVENTASEEETGLEYFTLNGNEYEGHWQGMYRKNGEDISKEEYEEAKSNAPTVNTSYYKSLTVPGGINYQELDIQTPQITPLIKSHAEFADKNKSIGWVRVDDLETDKSVRRLLELQSDLFQKGRNDKYLTNVDDKGTIKFSTEYADYTIEKETIKVKHENGFNESFTKRELTGREDEQEIRNAIEKYKDKSSLNKSENKFLQLLSKEGNWIKFFVQSIVQRTRKEVMYEKSLPDIEAKISSLQKQGLLKIECE